MNRRAFLVGSLTALAAPLAAGAQPKPLVGFLSPFSATTGFTTTSVQAFHELLRELGWSPGGNIRIEYRWADGKHERLDSLAEELIQLHPAVLVANSGPAASAAKRATTTIPIVFETLGDPVAARLVPSLSRPGGNLTGIAGISAELSGKRLEVLREVSAFPRAEDCHVTLASTVQAARQKYADEGWVSNPPGSGWYRKPVQGQVQVKCLPDTVDPRGPKAR